MAIKLRIVRVPPPAGLALLYALFITLGAATLKLPWAATAPISWSDAIFTATSAVTVTGLVVFDPGAQLTWFGQCVVMLLIQLGGLGLMTFAVLILGFLGFPVGLPQRFFLKEELNQTSVSDLLKLVGVIVRVVLICEFVGTLFLLLVFVPQFGWAQGSWHAVFHAVSAFNNAGFALFPDSLTRWATNPVVNLVIPALFIIGGIGFSVLADLYNDWRWRKLSLHTKLMLAGTGALIVISVAGFALLEWTNPKTLGLHASWGDKLIVSWFQGVTTRTAGFNTADIGSMHDSTALMFISLMVIGGGSTSTAGGIKVTTFVVLLLAVMAFFKRQQQLNAYGRSLGLEEVLKVLALVMISLLTFMAATFVIAISHDGNFLNLAFEVASALGTVGLSRGTTGQLDEIGRTAICFVMFLGRVGPLTLGFFLATRIPARIRYPSARILLG